MRRVFGVTGLAVIVLVSGARATDVDCPVQLTDVTAESGLDYRHETGAAGAKHLPETMGSGLAWLDFDRDGWLDLYVVQSGPFPPDGAEGAANRLYRNRGDGTFEDVGAAAGAGDRGYGQGVVSADVDGDGDEDLYICNYGADALLLNRGDGSFEDATERAGLGLDGWSSSAALADADGDGDLDLYVARYVEYDPRDEIFCGDVEAGERRYCMPTLFRGATDRLYRNRGDGTFEDATGDAGFAAADGRGLGVLFTDLDGDGHPDLYVANDLTINFLYRNRGDGTFEDLSLLSGTALNRHGEAEAGMGLAAGDIDGDGDPDLMVTNFDVETNTLYRNLGQMMFEDVAAESGFGVPSFNLLGFGIVTADFDLDGNLDAYLANGHIHRRPEREGVAYAQRDLLLLGDGGGGFAEPACETGVEPAVGRGLAAADHDNDGDLDLALLNSGGPLRLLRNDGSGKRWLGLRLRGTAPNTQAIGARVTIATGRTRQSRWVTAGDSYQSSSDKRLLFGLGPGDTLREVEVRWPGGTTTVLEDLVPGRYLDLPQGGALRPATTTEPGRGGRLWYVALVVLAASLAAAALLALARRRGVRS